MNARFWVWWNDGWVKLTLRPGQVVHLHESHPTDEGYSYTEEVYEHDGDEVIVTYEQGGSDCDGPLTHHCVCSARLSELQSTAEPECPPWRRVRAWQHDAYAEAAGY